MPLLNAHNLKLASLACKEESRFTLNAILVQPQSTVVTDGHILVEMSTPPGMKAENFPEIPGVGPAAEEWKPFLLPASDALAIARELPKKSNLPILQHAAVAAESPDNFVTVVTTDLERANPRTIKRPTGNFPDYQRVMPKPEADEYAVTFNPALMADVLKFVADWQGAKRGGYSGTCTLSFSSNRNAVRIDAEHDGQKLSGAIMPQRFDGSMALDSTQGLIERMRATNRGPDVPKAARERLAKLERQIAELRDLLGVEGVQPQQEQIDWYAVMGEAKSAPPVSRVPATEKTCRRARVIEMPSAAPDPTPEADPDSMDAFAVAAFLGINVATLYNRVKSGRIAAPDRTGRKMLWKRSEIAQRAAQ
jgi:predicted DNA-binding transcriptional regulator AlpA